MPRSRRHLKHPHVTVQHDDEEPKPLEVLVTAIYKLADAVDEIKDCGLSDECIVLLLHDATKVPKGQIRKVLEAAPLLAERYTRPEEAHGG